MLWGERGKERKGVARRKVYTYQLRINIHLETPFVNKTQDLETGGTTFMYLIFASS